MRASRPTGKMDRMEHKDVVVAILAAAGTIAGLSLVAFAVLAAVHLQLSNAVANEVRDQIGNPMKLLLANFMVGVLTIGAATWWMVNSHDNGALYVLTVVLFALQVVTLVGAWIWTAQRIFAFRLPD
jgi:apolipoprotein N-acyltransferase